ncbi:MAG TPA: 2-aminoethylphosphonate--pyruvate transaminase [Planctomycetota bacterium]
MSAPPPGLPTALPTAHDKLLFTPGPLTTSASVKQAMLRDLGSRDEAFLAAVREVRERLLALYGLSQASGWEAVPLQGSGTFAVEAALSSIVPRTGAKLLALVNGAYGERIVKMAAVHGIPCTVLRAGEDTPIEPARVAEALAADAALTHVSLVHVETTSGVLNPMRAVGEVVRAAGRVYFVDAMSAFGALPIEFEAAGIDFLAASANKCLEGIPGLAFVIARRKALETIEGRARSLALDLHAQWRGLEKDGQFRFTPPTHALLALRQALLELEQEGGVAGRGTRYRANHERLRAGMEAIGFRAYVPARASSPIISTFLYPEHPRFDFADFYRRLSARGFLIYPGKLTQADCFRLGNIGRLFTGDIDALLAAVPLVLREMGVELRISSQAP